LDDQSVQKVLGQAFLPGRVEIRRSPELHHVHKVNLQRKTLSGPPAVSYFYPEFGRIPGSAGDRALRLYLFCLWQKRIPLQSLARSVVKNFTAIYLTFLASWRFLL
jgi:hypothetical protein